MDGEWPLMARAAELHRVEGLLRSGAGGVVLAGPAGVGKTRLAGACLEVAAQREYVPLRVGATQAAATLPFGAFARLLPDLAAGTDRSEVLRQVRRSIIGRGNGKPVAVLIDDAHLLDESSAVLAHQLADDEDTFLVATVRAREPASDAVVALWKDALVDRIELRPFSVDEVEELLRAVLGGPVDAPTVRTMYDRTQGNLLFLKELVSSALETEVLHDDGGLWRLHGQVPASSRLVELIEARLGGLAAHERETLERVALGEPLGLALLEEDPVAVLEHRGLIRVEADGRRLLVRLAHPLHGDILRARLSPLRTRAVCRWLADAVTAAGVRRRDDPLRVATWQLQGGGPHDPDIMLTGARQSYARNDLTLSERLARAASEAGGGFDADVLLGLVLSISNRREQAELILNALQPETDAQRLVLATTRIAALFYLRRLGAALAVAEVAEQQIDDPQAKAEVAAFRTLLLYLSGDVRDARALCTRCLPEASGRGLVMASLMATWLFASAGRFRDALDAADRGLQAHLALDGQPVWWRPQHHSFGRADALAHAGRLTEAEAAARGQYDLAVADGATDVQAYLALGVSRALNLEGQPRSAAHWARLALAPFRDRAEKGNICHALAQLALGLASVGRPGDARAALRELDEISASKTAGWLRFGLSDVLRAEAWTSLAEGDAVGAVGRLHEAVAVARADESFADEAHTLHDLARLGHAAKVAARLSELVALVEGPMVRARADHAISLAARNPRALEAASLAFEAMPAWLLAAEAAADASVAWRKAGDPRKAAAAERRAHALTARCEGARTPALVAVTARATLTAREVEIARLAAAGVPNKEIAARLALSLHTVQNKLHAAYEKLGTEGRAGLADALEQDS